MLCNSSINQIYKSIDRLYDLPSVSFQCRVVQGIEAPVIFQGEVHITVLGEQRYDIFVLFACSAETRKKYYYASDIHRTAGSCPAGSAEHLSRLPILIFMFEW